MRPCGPAEVADLAACRMCARTHVHMPLPQVDEVDALLPEEGVGRQAGLGARHVLSMRFLNVTEERVQDLLQSDCHAHDLELRDEPHGAIVRVARRHSTYSAVP